MTLNERVIKALEPLNVSVTVAENPTDSGVPDKFIVIIPTSDNFDLYADNEPLAGADEAELALYCKGNYLAFRDKVTELLTAADITITSRRYLEFEKDTDYHHYIIDVAAETSF
ncbi:MAG: hypothetical protein NC299_13430 [Lachnospiraceae bacterium]|nr:hypothetical protein [Ruminococcus sp.]MCM1276338.1 hypothetical protein [Lachnospiraceae bacterium]